MTDHISSTDPSQWVELYGDTLYAFAMSRLHDQAAAEEAVQEAFLSALRHVEQFRGDGHEGAWLMGILKRKVIDSQRKQSRQPLELEADDAFVSSLFDQSGHWSSAASSRRSQALDSLEREEFNAIFQKCLKGLPATQASVFSLKEIQQESSESVCKLLEISPSNLWVLMHRARIRLAECIKARWEITGA